MDVNTKLYWRRMKILCLFDLNSGNNPISVHNRHDSYKTSTLKQDDGLWKAEGSVHKLFY